MKILIKLLILLPIVLQAQRNDSFKTVNLTLDSIFTPKLGTFILHKIDTDTLSIYNKKRAEEYFPAHSTIKILCSIAAFEQNVVNEDDYLNWDSIKYPRQDWWLGEPYKHWTENHNVISALRYSVNWYFLELLKKMDMKKTKSFFDKMNFGIVPDTLYPFYFFISNKTYTSAIKEADFLNRLHQNKLGISPTILDLILKALLSQADTNYKLYSKTGIGNVSSGKIIGWIVGIIEKQNDKYVYVINLEYSESDTLPMIQQELHDKLRRILIALRLDKE